MTEKTIDRTRIYYYGCVDSTNTVALSLDKTEHLLTVISDSQTMGKGRMGRSFYSFPGGLYMSIIIDPKKISLPLNLITPIAALGVKKQLDKLNISNCGIKWVNDILVDGKKVCGILTESRYSGEKLERIVVGIGININSDKDSYPPDIRNKATSIAFSGDKLVLASDITKTVGEYLTKSTESVINDYRNNMLWIGKSITITDYRNNNEKVSGTVLGVDNNCYLKLKLDDGTERIFFSGEIT